MTLVAGNGHVHDEDDLLSRTISDLEGWVDRIAGQICRVEVWKGRMAHDPRLGLEQPPGGPASPSTEARVRVLSHEQSELRCAMEKLSRELRTMAGRLEREVRGVGGQVEQMLGEAVEYTLGVVEQRVADDVKAVVARVDALSDALGDVRDEVHSVESEREASADALRQQLEQLRARLEKLQAALRKAAEDQEAGGARVDALEKEQAKTQGAVDALGVAHGKTREAVDAVAREQAATKSVLSELAEAHGKTRRAVDALESKRVPAAASPPSNGSPAKLQALVEEQARLQDRLARLETRTASAESRKGSSDARARVTGDAARVNDASSLERLRAEMVACFNDELRTLHGGWDEAIARVREDAERQVTAIREQLQRLESRISEGVPEAAAAAMETAVAPLRSTVVSAEQVGQWAEQAARIHALALELGKGDSTEGPLAQLASLTAALSGARDAVASGELRFTVSASLASLRPDELMAHVQAEALRCVREVADVLAQGDGVRRRLVETLVPAVVDLCEPPPQQVDDVIVRLPLEGPLLALVQAAGLEDVCPARLSPYDAKTQTVVTVVPSADAACKNRLAGCFKRGFRHGGRMVRRAAVTRFIVGDAR